MNAALCLGTRDY